MSLSLRGGADVRTEDNLDDRVTPFAQLVLARQLTPRLEIFVAPTLVGEAGVYDYAFNLPIGAAWMIRPYLCLAAEVVPENRDQPDGFDSDFGWSIGLKRAIGGHFFEFLVGNTRSTHVSQYTTSSILVASDPDGLVPLDASDVYIGFNIERRFGGR